MQTVSPQNRAAIQVLARLGLWPWKTARRTNWRSFALRFAPLWVPVLLIWALPMPHEIARYNGFMLGTSYTSALRHALDEPDNLGAQLSAIEWTQVPGAPAPYLEEDALEIPSRDRWLKRIETHFHQDYLARYLLQRRMEMALYGVPSAPSGVLTPTSERGNALALRQIIERGMRAAPRNAFWIVERARWEWTFAPRPHFAPPQSNFAGIGLPPTGPPFAPPAPPPGVPFNPPSGVVVANSFLLVPGMTQAVELPGPHSLPSLVPNHEPVLKRTLEILRKARGCTFYDDGSIEAAREMRRDWKASYPDVLEEDLSNGRSGPEDQSNFLVELRSQLWAVGSPALSAQIRPPYAPIGPVEPPIARFGPREVLSTGAAMAHIGNLLDALSQLARERRRRPVYAWLEVGWNLDVAPTLNRSGIASWKRGKGAGSARFAQKARALGASDLAPESLLIEAQVAAHDALWKRADARRFILPVGYNSVRIFSGGNALIPRFAVWSAVLCNLAGTCLLGLAGLWMFLNVFLAHGMGMPSSRRARLLPAVGLILPLFVLAVWLTGESASGTGKMARLLEIAPPHVGLMAPVLAVLLALVCAVVTVALHRRELVHPDDDKWHTKLLPANVRPLVEPVLLGVSALLVLVSGLWLAWLTLTPFAFSSPLVGSFTTGTMAGALGVYGCLSGALSFGIWLINWRWPSQQVRPITHGGLRWWKETLGASMCIMLWLYLGLALAAWPARSQAKQMLDQRWEVGDWVWLQRNS